MDQDRAYLTPEELSQRWRGRISTKTLANWRSARRGPAFAKISGRIIYPLPEVERWERERIAELNGS